MIFEEIIIDKFRRIEQAALADARAATASATCDEIVVLVTLDGVTDRAVYNIKQDRFTELIVSIADYDDDEPIELIDYNGKSTQTAYSKKARYETIKL